MADPISLSLIITVAAKAGAIIGRMMEALKEKSEELESIQLLLDSMRRIEKYAKESWKNYKKDDEVLLKGVKGVKKELKELEKDLDDKLMKFKVVIGISQSVREKLESIDVKVNRLTTNFLIRRSNESNDYQSDKTNLQELEKVHNRAVKRLQRDLAKGLSDDDFKKVELTKAEYDDYVKGGVHVRIPPTKFPCSDLVISKSVPKCTKLILKFLNQHNENFNKIRHKERFNRSDHVHPMLPRYCLEKVFKEILPKELKLFLLKRSLSRDAAALFDRNIERLRNSLHNPQFKKIRYDYDSKMDLSSSKWNKYWVEVSKESRERLLELQLGHQQGQHQGHHNQHHRPQPGDHQGQHQGHHRQQLAHHQGHHNQHHRPQPGEHQGQHQGHHRQQAGQQQGHHQGHHNQQAGHQQGQHQRQHNDHHRQQPGHHQGQHNQHQMQQLGRQQGQHQGRHDQD